MGSMIPDFNHGNKHYYMFALWTYGSLEIYFQWLKGKPPFDDESKRLELLKRINETPEVNIPPDGITRRPSIRLDVLAKPEAMERFLGALDWALEEIRAT
jgi:hypothetical protein